MCTKFVLILAIIAKVSVQFAHSIHCYTCFEQGACTNYTETYCDPISAEATLRSVNLFYGDINFINTNEFECFIGRYGSNNQPFGDLRGCIAKGAIDCVKNKEQHGRELCTLCDTELCNSGATIPSRVLMRSSVDTISSSVFITLGLFVLSKLL